MQDAEVFPEPTEILDTLGDDALVETERVERATVGEQVAERVDLVAETVLEVTERGERAAFPESEYGRLCGQRVPYAECYNYAPEGFSEAVVEFVETGCRPQRCGDCEGDGTTVCSSCGGQGTKSCTRCGGFGKQECSDCGGSGQVTDIDGWLETCSTCGGNGKVTCDAIGCSGGRKDCGGCHGRGRQQCSLCSGEGTVVVAVHGTLEFTETRTVEMSSSSFETDLFELDGSDGELLDRSREEPTDRIGEGSEDPTRVWRRVTERRSIPCVSVTYTCDGETYTAGWVDGDVRRGEYPPSEVAVREQIEDAVEDDRFTYDSSPDDGVTGLVVDDAVTTGKTLLWVFAGLLAVSAVFAGVEWVLGSGLPDGPISSTITGVVSSAAILGISLYVTTRRHRRRTDSISGRSLSALAAPVLAVVVAVGLLATGRVSLSVGGALLGLAVTLWGVSVARHLRDIAEEATVIDDRRRTFLEETLTYPRGVVDRHDVGDLLPDPQGRTERRAERAGTVVGVGCVGLASLYTVGTLVLSLLASEGATPASVEPLVVAGFLAPPTVLILIGGGALFTIRR